MGIRQTLNNPYRRGVLAIAIALSFALLAVSLVGRATGNWELLSDQLLVHGWVLLWLMAITYGLRSLGLLDILRFWFFGYFVVAGIVVALGRPSAALLGATSELQVALWIPILEETAKLLPIVLFVLWLKPRLTMPTLSDIVVASFAIGSAFAFREDLVRERLAAHGFDASFWGVLLPSTLHDGPRFIAAHGGWTIVAAVGIGLVAIHRRWWAYALALLGWLLAVLDHSAVNSRGELSEGLNSLMFDGQVVAVALVAIIIGAVLHDFFVLRSAAELDDRFSSWITPTPGSLQGWYASSRYRQLLVGARMHAWRGVPSGDQPQDRTAIVEHLAELATQVRDDDRAASTVPH